MVTESYGQNLDEVVSTSPRAMFSSTGALDTFSFSARARKSCYSGGMLLSCMLD